jgi:DNA-directed RNA polymerase subunit omega
MARVTIEDCINKVESRFELVMLASCLARKIKSGGHPNYSTKKSEKESVSALREIASDFIDIKHIKQLALTENMAIKTQENILDAEDIKSEESEKEIFEYIEDGSMYELEDEEDAFDEQDD